MAALYSLAWTLPERFVTFWHCPKK